MIGFSFSSAALLAALLSTSARADEVEVHGSGTTNPSKCYWAVMEQMMAQTKENTHMTYRAVGSTTGYAEFINEYSEDGPANDFASGDLPLNKTVYDNFDGAGVGLVHLPVLLGAVSIFHSVKQVERLNLTPCLLARIFSLDITEWNHPDIVEFNSALGEVGDDEDMTITVARRVRGSSSTDSTTKYLLDACPEHWSEELTGSKPTWPEGTVGCEGSGGMTTCIRNTPGTIGYIDAGHGIGAGLKEIELENLDGTLQSSAEAAAQGGIAAAEDGVLPAAPDRDFSGVSLLNRPGKYTWPIVQMTYIVVRKDLSYFEDPESAAFMVAFLRALFMDDYIEQCADNYGFTLPSQSVRDFALEGIAMLQLPENTTQWIFETSTLPLDGQEEHVISSKRQRIADAERSSLQSSVASLEAENAALRSELNTLSSKAGMTDKEQTQLTAALVLSCLCFIYLVIFSIFPLIGCFRKKTE
eukprot:CAMPEP_0172439606 /NCGR_PEP_ID=MMETSP1065-20121228/528_1 /TAXON_ID=265537 /ORGANISM="Amphiprora paludosa, Strain CCMP125" /LENGTH=470 /DNA_ID=CAMNT_0013188309 /DNA_START=59 /DNA_END=1471 /DNA_ORIENTATION=-